MELEAPIVHLPMKRLKFLYTSTTLAIEKDIQAIVSKIQYLKANTSKLSAQDAHEILATLINRLETLQRKLEETNRQQVQLTDHLRSRINTITSFTNSSSVHDDIALKLWYRQQTDRMVVDWLVREGCYEMAQSFSFDSKMADFEDIDLFMGKVKPVIEGLSQGNLEEVEKWMHANALKLKKCEGNLVAKFELELRLQSFVSHVIAGRSADAIAYAQATFLPYTQMGGEWAERVRHAMGFLVFLGAADSPVSQQFLGEERYRFLIEEFHKLFFTLYGLPEAPLLSIAVISGLHALSTPACLIHSTGAHSLPDAHSLSHPDCPACNPELKLALQSIPLSNRPTSSLVCPLTRKPIDEDNPPMALPNGQVYSRAAIDQGSKNTANLFIDPKTGQHFPLAEIRRVFIM